ncbi:RDD family protein [Streptacidiphilus sp. N1-12]|uniref:RDD family protein n=2 Tax=Streptacidiphilus alkalitolerans TaxID=3342712 RepID=A0ABV6WNF5_9ACTN
MTSAPSSSPHRPGPIDLLALAEAEVEAEAQAQAQAEALALQQRQHHRPPQVGTSVPAPSAEAAAPGRVAPGSAPGSAEIPAPASGRGVAPAPTTAPAPAPGRAAAPARGSAPAGAPASNPNPAPAPGRGSVQPGVRSGAGAAGRRGPRPAVLGRRLAARLVDLAVVVGAVAALGAPVIQQAVAHVQEKVDSARLLPGQTKVWLVDPQTLTALGQLALGLLVVGLFYEALPTALWGRTLGKALFGLRVLDRRSKQKPGFGRSLTRWLSYQLLLLLPLVGLLDLVWCMVDRPWRQCWHDKIGRTFVAPARPAAPARPVGPARPSK